MRHCAAVSERSGAETLSRHEGLENGIVVFTVGSFNGKRGFFKEPLAAHDVDVESDGVYGEVLREKIHDWESLRALNRAGGMPSRSRYFATVRRVMSHPSLTRRSVTAWSESGASGDSVRMISAMRLRIFCCEMLSPSASPP